MSEKFTPGPWELLPLKDSDSVRVFSGSHYIGLIGNSDDEPSQTRANARLIAAAPDMYEALMAMRFAYMNKDGEYPHDFEIDALDMYEHAMKKADGTL